MTMTFQKSEIKRNNFRKQKESHEKNDDHQDKYNQPVRKESHRNEGKNSQKNESREILGDATKLFAQSQSKQKESPLTVVYMAEFQTNKEFLPQVHPIHKHLKEITFSACPSFWLVFAMVLVPIL